MPKVMLIEDDKIMLSLLRTLLELEGYQVFQFDPDNDVLEAIQTELPDVVVLDYQLKNINGLDILRIIREDEKLGSTRVLMSSGLDVRRKCLAAGADGFLLKPFMPDDLIKLIRNSS